MSGTHSHSHAHGDADDLYIPAQLARRLRAAVVPVALVVLVGLVALWPRGEGPNLRDLFGSQEVTKATVVTVESELCAGGPVVSGDTCQFVRVRLREGPRNGEVVRLEAGGNENLPSIDVGDTIVVGSSSDGRSRSYYFSDYDRESPILLLVALFVVAAIAFGRMGGLRALGALAASLVALVWFVIPAVLHGHSPIAVALIGSALIMLVVLYLTGGFNTRTTVAVLGTMASLALIAALAWGFVEASKLTGLADEDAAFLSAAASTINLQGLLLGGIIIGSLGVLDDMTVTQVATVWELRRANAEFDTPTLYRAAARVGRQHVASTINTLVLAYAGASLPLLIYFTQSNLALRQIVTSEVIAMEIVRTLVGSIGLIASVPITTALAAFVVTRPQVAVSEPVVSPLTGSSQEPEADL